MAISSSTVRAAAPAKNPTIYNVVTPLTPATEFSQELGPNTKQFLVKVRGNATLQLAFFSGDSGTLYITLDKHTTFTQENLDASVTLYMQCDKALQTVEILEWT